MHPFAPPARTHHHAADVEGQRSTKICCLSQFPLRWLLAAGRWPLPAIDPRLISREAATVSPAAEIFDGFGCGDRDRNHLLCGFEERNFKER